MLTPHLKKSACHQPARQRQLALACDPGLNLAALLANLPHTNEWVFGGRLRNWDRATKIIQTGSKTRDWHRHDLRRTVATCFGRLGKSPYLSEALLNHAELHSKLSRIYNKATYHAEVAEALQEWADALDAVIAGDADIIERLKR
jgi:hypothetical protein